MRAPTFWRGWALIRVDGPVGVGRALLRKLKRVFRNSRVLSETSFVADVLLEDCHQSNGVMMDVGAHHGAVFAEFAKRGWQVYAFEPDKKNLKRVSVAFGRFNNVFIDNRAVSNVSAAKAAFYVSSQSSGISGLSAFDESHKQSGVVTTVTVEDFVEAEGVQDIDYLKIDTEGYDLMVLKGFPWGKIRPRVIVCEFENRKTIPLGYNFHDIADFISAKGYGVIVSEWFPISKYGSEHRWRRYESYPCELVDDAGWGNLIASSDDRLLAKLLQRFETETERA